MLYYLRQIILGKEYGPAVDWWSLGVTIYALITGLAPFMNSNSHQLQHAIIHSNVYYPPLLDSVTVDVLKGVRLSSCNYSYVCGETDFLFFNNMMLYCIVLYCIVLYCIVFDLL